ncbi:MAG: hypothetical protein ACI4I4_04640 [Acutalibacteraceae bacterium]
MKKRSTALILSMISLLFIFNFTFTAYAVGQDINSTGEMDDDGLITDDVYSEDQGDTDTSQEPVYSEPDNSEPQYSEPQYSEPDYSEPDYSEPDYSYPPQEEPVPSSGYDFIEDDSSSQDSYQSDVYQSYTDGSDEAYDDSYTSSTVESNSADLYDVDNDVDTDELSKSDWDIALDLNSNNSNDFKAIKNNKSSEDTSNMWMLILGCVMLGVSVIGIISVIAVCKKKSNNLKKAKAYAGTRPSGRKTQNGKTVYIPKNKDTQEIDISLPDNSRFDDYDDDF